MCKRWEDYGYLRVYEVIIKLRIFALSHNQPADACVTIYDRFLLYICTLDMYLVFK